MNESIARCGCLELGSEFDLEIAAISDHTTRLNPSIAKSRISKTVSRKDAKDRKVRKPKSRNSERPRLERSYRFDMIRALCEDSRSRF
jgi:hypothetical protein